MLSSTPALSPRGASPLPPGLLVVQMRCSSTFLKRLCAGSHMLALRSRADALCGLLFSSGKRSRKEHRREHTQAKRFWTAWPAALARSSCRSRPCYSAVRGARGPPSPERNSLGNGPRRTPAGQRPPRSPEVREGLRVCMSCVRVHETCTGSPRQVLACCQPHLGGLFSRGARDMEVGHWRAHGGSPPGGRPRGRTCFWALSWTAAILCEPPGPGPILALPGTGAAPSSQLPNPQL